MNYKHFTINDCKVILLPYGQCLCGCGGITLIAHRNDLSRKHKFIKGQHKKYLRGHHPPQNGPDNPNWHGGSFVHHGYKMVTNHSHPRAHNNHYVFEHILLAEKALGKPLPKGVQVHHHTPEQLVICQDPGYHKLLHYRQRALAACGHANWKKCAYCRQYDAPENLFVARQKSQPSYHYECRRAFKNKRYAELKALAISSFLP